MTRIGFSIFYFITLFSSQLCAQTYKLESFNYLGSRNAQLLNFYDSTISHTVLNNSFFPVDENNWKRAQLRVLPIILTNQYNTRNPFGWNDGVMTQTNGYQLLVRPGFNFRYGFFEIQNAPEYHFASNNSYPTTNLYGNNSNKSFSNIYWGQTFAKVHLGSITFGLSNENLWWGPGVNSALLMSNNAPGFWHIQLSSKKPIMTPFGSIEFNLIGAKLNSDKNFGYEINNLQIRNINDDWRYLNSYVFSWQPKWVSGLFIGMTRSLQQYGKNAFQLYPGFLNKYLPVIGLPIEKRNILGDDTLTRDQLASFFLRWVFPKSNLEFYLEYGKNDYGINIRDYLLSPTHSSAYIVGFRKIVVKNNKQIFNIGTEFSQMSQSPDHLVRTAGNWYEHSRILQGYTNYNQIIGSGAGYGTNIQTITFNWVKGDINNEILVQRLERDPVDKVYKWTDFSIGWMPKWKLKNMLLGAKLQFVRSNNYSWEKGNHSFNMHSRLMIQYNFK